MPIAMLLLLPPMGSVDEVLARYAGWKQAHPSFSVESGVATPGMKVPIKLNLSLKKPDSIALRVRAGEADYRLAKTAQGQTETESSERVYDESDGTPGLRMNVSDISELQRLTFPGWLTAEDLKRAFPGKPTAEKATVDGKSLDLVHTNASDKGSAYEAWGWFDASGAPVKLRQKIVSMQGSSDLTWTFAAFKPLAKDAFRLEIPQDYAPHRLPNPGPPLEIGTALKLGTWRRGGKPIDLDHEAEGTALLAVLTPGAAPSERVAPMLADLEKGGLKVVRISDAASDPTMAYDPTGKLLDAIYAPATPFLLLVKSGKIAGLWLGAPDDARSMATEIQSVAK